MNYELLGLDKNANLLTTVLCMDLIITNVIKIKHISITRKGVHLKNTMLSLVVVS